MQKLDILERIEDAKGRLHLTVDQAALLDDAKAEVERLRKLTDSRLRPPDRYIVHNLPGRVTRDAVSVVLASEYDYLRHQFNVLTRELDLTNVAYRASVAQQDKIIKSLEKSLKTANNNHEHFEKEYYLRGDVIERLEHALGHQMTVAGEMLRQAEKSGRAAEQLYTALKDLYDKERLDDDDIGLRHARTKATEALKMWENL